MDVRMPRLDGISAAREIRQSVPGAAVVVLTELDSAAARAGAQAAGCAGYVLKCEDLGRLTDRLATSVQAGGLRWLGTGEEGTETGLPAS
jgi:DNA-binding NarL/FixJ family response regulator